MYSDLRSFGYNPYAPEFAALIREGKANRSYWRIMAPLVDATILHRIGPGREVTRSLRWLGLTPGDLRVTKPRAPTTRSSGAGSCQRHRAAGRLSLDRAARFALAPIGSRQIRARPSG